MSRFDVVAFDADDTLWQNERNFMNAQERFRALLSAYHSKDWVDERLYEAEVRNLPHFGYGVKAFALSMIETAIELTEGRISNNDIKSIIDTAREMIAADIELLDHAAETLSTLSVKYDLMLVTKGDLRDQESKLARSGLASHFEHVEIVSDKQSVNYATILDRHRIAPRRFLMVGNSLRSDVLPVLELGASAVYVPHELTWSHEAADPPPEGRPGYHRIHHLGELPALVEKLERESVQPPEGGHLGDRT